MRFNRKISPNEFLELQVRLNKAVANSPNNQEIIGAYKDLKKALEKDFGSIKLNPGEEVFLKYPPQNANIANQILEPAEAIKKPIGEIQAEMGRKLNNEAIDSLRKQLHDANNFYQNNIVSFTTSLANKVGRSFDKNLFTEKQLAGFIESGNINKDQLATMLSNNIFKSGAGRQSFDAITDLQKLLEADVHKYNPKTDKSILHIDEKKNLRIDDLDLHMEELVNEILSSQIIDNEEKCILLYETTNYIGDNSLYDAEFDGFEIINASSTVFSDGMYVSLFIKNLTNERGTTGAFLNEAFGPQPSQGFYGSNSREFYALPRTIGFSISRGF